MSSHVYPNPRNDSIYIFAGPTLAKGIASRFPEYVFMPPASCGDIRKLVVKRNVKAIGIIDGYFGWCRSVFHKEVLYAIDRGIKVVGASSMGALRAAELDRFGMIGIGDIYEGFRDGILEDDDEVAITHAPEELGFLPITEALVDIRDRIKDGLKQGHLATNEAEALLAYGKALHFTKRSWPLLIANLEAQGMDVPRFKKYLSEAKLSAKERDAIRLLINISKIAEMPRKTLLDCGYVFENTSYWQRLEKDPNR